MVPKVVIQARMGSTRFPGKVLANLDGAPLLAHQIALLSRAGYADLVVATSTLSRDDAIQAFCDAQGVQCFRGDEANVFSRYEAIAEKVASGSLVRLTGDNPIVSREVLGAVVRRHQELDADFTSTRRIQGEAVERFVPQGWSVDVINVRCFKDLSGTQLSPFEIEHVIPAFYRPQFVVSLARDFIGLELESCSIDTPEDLDELASRVRSAGGVSAYATSVDAKVRSYLQSKAQI